MIDLGVRVCMGLTDIGWVIGPCVFIGFALGLIAGRREK